MGSRCIRCVFAIILSFGCMALAYGTARADSFDNFILLPENSVLSPQNFIINGTPVKMTAINSDGINYIRLGELARYLDVDAFCDAPWIQFDKTKTFNGVRVLTDATAEAREAALIVFGEEKIPSDFNLDKVFTDNLGTIRPWLKFYDGDSLSPVKYDGYIYVSLISVADKLNVGLEYDIATNTVILDKTKAMKYPYVVADGGLVCPITYTTGWYGEVGAFYFTGEPGAVASGLIIEARYEAYPNGKVYRTTEYNISKDFPITDITIFGSGIEFDYQYDGGDGLTDPPGFSEWGAPDADRGPYLNALRKVLNYDLVDGSGVADTPQNRMAQAKLFSVFINGDQATGTIEHRWLGTTATSGMEEYFLAFDKEYQLGEIETIRVELNGVGVK